MRTTTRFRCGVVALLAALGGSTAAATGAATAAANASYGERTTIHWAPAGTATVHPGVVVTMAGVSCLAGFVLTDGHRVFLAVPASCTGVSDGQATNGCLEAQVPFGIPATIAGARYKGRLVYSSFTMMQLRGDTNVNRCANNSLSLVQLDRRDIRRTNPSIPTPVGGPSGVASTTPAAGDLLTVAAATRVTALSSSNGSGGWAHDVLPVAPAAITRSDLGAPTLNSSGRGIGMVTVVSQATAGTATVSDLARELRSLQRMRAFAHVYLALGTVAFTPTPGTAALR